jgi:mannose-1-phosphate guanylyltransferase/mannose-1-phosphate guanylyltransferase/mannose-6-phosphate isomerase
VTFGIRPTGPETGYGYPQLGGAIAQAPGAMEVLRFIAKPPLEVAEAMVADGGHLWNAGIILFRAGSFLAEMDAFAPEIARVAERAIATSARDGIRIRPDIDILTDCPSESVDCAVMEKSSRVAVVPMSSGWSDLGSWDAIAQHVGPGSSARVTTVDCENCYIRSEGLEVAALGLRDLIIIASGQRLLILPRGRSQEVKKLLSAMDSKAA